MRILDPDQLEAALPFGALALQGKLASDGELNVDMRLVTGSERATCFALRATRAHAKRYVARRALALTRTPALPSR